MAGLYNGKWQKARASFLRAHPLCGFCLNVGRLIPASVVDHIEPHRGDLALFWDRDNWQSLCKQCHDSHKQRAEKSGHVVGCDEAGIPLDTAHHWRATRRA